MYQADRWQGPKAGCRLIGCTQRQEAWCAVALRRPATDSFWKEGRFTVATCTCMVQRRGGLGGSLRARRCCLVGLAPG